MSEMYKVVSIDNAVLYEEYHWSVDRILKEINRDTSDSWTDYDQSDWKDGWLEWCEGDYYTIPSLKQKGDK